MIIFKHTKDLVNYLQQINYSKRSVGFVPTMGALHQGHLSLVETAKANNGLVICSIFVNPTQFNNQDDLDKYPSTLDKDIELLERVGCDILFSPTFDDIYPDGADYKIEVDLKGLDLLMEGAFRPGHFEGVVQVVKAFLDIVRPSQLYMGQKDFQQFTIIRQMIDSLKMEVELVVVPIKREANGLAMSSRNARLSEANKSLAAAIYSQMLEAKSAILAGETITVVQESAMKALEAKGFEPEYFDVVNTSTLLPVDKRKKGIELVICVAAWLQGVRLIDNEIIEG